MGTLTPPAPDPEEIARPTRDPALLPHAELVTAEAGEIGTPLSWRIQPDGSLTVVLPSGKKINRPMPGTPVTSDEPAGGVATPAKKSETSRKIQRKKAKK